MQGVYTYIGTFGGRKMAGGFSGGYTFGFNGQYKDDEVYGEGNSYTAEFWQYDPRLGRRWNVDPLSNKYPAYSPYSVFENSPISIVDIGGDSTVYFMKGRIVHISHDSHKNAIVHLISINDVHERLILNFINVMSSSGKGDDFDLNTLARRNGNVYMLDGVDRFKIVSRKSPVVNKWGDRAETGARLYKNGNTITVGSKIAFSSSASKINDNEYPDYDNSDGSYTYRTIHGHNNAGKGGWPYGISEEDARFLRFVSNDIFNIANDNRYLYLWNPSPPEFGDKNYEPIAFSWKYLFDRRSIEKSSDLFKKVQQQSISGQKTETVEKNLGIE